MFSQRRKVEFAAHLQKVAAEYSEAEEIIVILDNLNTHNEISFYEAFSAEEARRLLEKFEFIYTPKKASWLNIIEIEFSALSRLCLDRRISSKSELEKQVIAIVKERSETQIKIKINWQFSIEKALKKLNRHYEKVIMKISNIKKFRLQTTYTLKIKNHLEILANKRQPTIFFENNRKIIGIFILHPAKTKRLDWEYPVKNEDTNQ